MLHKKKIIVLDIESPEGHLFFNSQLINFFSNSNVHITLVFKQGYIKKLKLLNNDYDLIEIPLSKYQIDSNGFINRLYYLKRLIYLKHIINLKEYDEVYFSSFEEISFYFSKITNVNLFVHNNVDSCANLIKRIFLKENSKKNTLLVLNENIQKKMNLHNIKSILKKNIINYDLLKINFNEVYDEDLIKIIKNRKIIFSPSISKESNIFLNKMIESLEFNDYLKKKSIIIIGKYHSNYQNSNLYFYKGYIEEAKYRSLFIKAKIILILHNKSYFRESNLFHECRVNNKLFVTNSINILEYNKSCVKHPLLIQNFDDLINVFNKAMILINNNNEFFQQSKD